jgi:hypothetical protein
MKLTPPKQVTFWIGLILGLAGVVLFFFMPAQFLIAFWVLFLGFALLVLGLILKGF